ncbi:MAG: lytic murein transglycosylase [Phaeovulum sp.]|uniref:lytic murein transglycosylase n=1 Tax=Phaeovulum sp. TaxID=2934796 RepID=UPI0027355DE7|nr:lytic murein transglycosylase [Phaeovulum sp.]MDP3860024.1 lytic murein transglycosylase [Phaeovulum sp.]
MRFLSPAFAMLLLTTPAHAQCGGDFSAFVTALKPEIRAEGLTARQVDGFLAGVTQDARVLRADRAQSFFRKDFIEFSRLLVSQNRMQAGAANLAKYRAIFDRAEAEYGVSRGVLTAFWGLETDFGAFQGDYNTRDALVTLAHDCRRPELFRPQILAAARLFARGDFDIAGVGAWAGEIGQVQMLPIDIERSGVDGDGDGHVNLRSSPADALLSGARMLQSLGWRAGEPWLQEIIVPEGLDWSKTGLETQLSTADWSERGVRAREGSLARGLKASVVLPMGRKGPAFIAYPNFSVLFEWNQSFAYVTTAAYYATRLLGAPAYQPGTPDPLLSLEDMKALQRALAARGHDVGKVDGILGAMTRTAVQKEQMRLGLPADAWPTLELLRKL